MVRIIVVLIVLLAFPIISFAWLGQNMIIVEGGDCFTLDQQTTNDASRSIGQGNLTYYVGTKVPDSYYICQVYVYLLVGAGDPSGKTLYLQEWTLNADRSLNAQVGGDIATLTGVSGSAWYSFGSVAHTFGSAANGQALVLTTKQTDGTNYMKIGVNSADAVSNWDNRLTWDNVLGLQGDVSEDLQMIIKGSLAAEAKMFVPAPRFANVRTGGLSF